MLEDKIVCPWTVFFPLILLRVVGFLGSNVIIYFQLEKGLFSSLVMVSVDPSCLVISSSKVGLVGGVRMGSAMSSMAMDATEAKIGFQQIYPTCSWLW